MSDPQVFDMDLSDAKAALDTSRTSLTSVDTFDGLGDSSGHLQDEQPDGWSTDDCSSIGQASPESSRLYTSPPNAAQNFDEADRCVVDAILAELQSPMQAAIQRSVSEMIPWIKEEIGFARQQLEDDIRTAVIEKFNAQPSVEARVQSDTIDALRRDFEGIEARMLEYDAQKTISNIEARLSEREAEWRAQQAGHDACVEALNTVSTQCSNLAEAVAAQAADLKSSNQQFEKCSSLAEAVAAQAADLKSSNQQFEKFKTQLSVDAGVQPDAIDALRKDIEARLSVGEAERRALQAGLEKCSEDISDALNTVNRKSSDLEEALAEITRY